MTKRIDEQRLTKAELAEYRKRLAWRGHPATPLPETEMLRIREAVRRARWAACAIMLLIVVLAIVTLGDSDIGVGGAIGMALGVGAPFVWAFIPESVREAATNNACKRLAEAYLDEIGYAKRTHAPPKAATGAATGSSSDDGPVYWATGTYDPERYYRGTSGWSKEVRDYVRDAYGSLDNYESNKPD